MVDNLGERDRTRRKVIEGVMMRMTRCLVVDLQKGRNWGEEERGFRVKGGKRVDRTTKLVEHSRNFGSEGCGRGGNGVGFLCRRKTWRQKT